MKRLALILAGVAVAGGVAVTPAVAGLVGNPSFSHEIPVPAPSAAKAPQFADNHSDESATVPTSATAKPGGRRDESHEAEPGDDGGIIPHVEPGNDHGGLTPHVEPGDDHGGGAATPEPSDDGGSRHGDRR